MLPPRRLSASPRTWPVCREQCHREVPYPLGTVYSRHRRELAQKIIHVDSCPSAAESEAMAVVDRVGISSNRHIVVLEHKVGSFQELAST